MSLFRRSYYGQEPTFTPLFRFLDDFENFSREVSGPGGRSSRHSQQTVLPRFDVRETETAFELHGELPGIDRKDLTIEFTEPQTMVIRGRVERSYSTGTPPNEAVEAVEEKPAEVVPEETQSHKATVSDEETEAAKEKGESATTVAETPKKDQVAPKPKEHYWHQERSVGQFHRTFTFPSRVDDAAVSANLNNGILSVTVPKAAKHESHRIEIN